MANGERIVPSFTTYLEAGCGFGGSCFPKDVKALAAYGEKLERPMWLLNSVLQVNSQQPQQVLNLLQKHFPSLNGVRVAVLGLAFKPGTDDMRESPAIPVINALLAQKATIKAYDLVAVQEARRLFGNHQIVYPDSLEQALADVEVVILLTSWKEFERVPELLSRANSQPLVIDGRRMLDKHSVTKYEGIGLKR
jgi:UDPglucose 6-dehydrogenase/GDP-mannose 6-dehydrogenase